MGRRGLGCGFEVPQRSKGLLCGSSQTKHEGVGFQVLRAPGVDCQEFRGHEFSRNYTVLCAKAVMQTFM